MPHHSLSPRQYLILGFVSLCAPLGDSCLSRGMTRMPSISLVHPGALIAAVFTPWIEAGIALLIGVLRQLSDGIVVGRSHIRSACHRIRQRHRCAAVEFWLHETISLERWAGIVLITVGVGFVAQGPHCTDQAVLVREASSEEPVATEVPPR